MSELGEVVQEVALSPPPAFRLPRSPGRGDSEPLATAGTPRSPRARAKPPRLGMTEIGLATGSLILAASVEIAME